MDWQALGGPEVAQWLSECQSGSESSYQYGGAIHVLREFLVPENASLKEWLWMMGSDIHHQVVPFLIEILETSSTLRSLGSILEVLGDLASKWYVREYFNETYPERARWEAWARRLNDAVRAGIPCYERLVHHDLPVIQSLSRDLLDVLEKTRA